MSYPQQVLMISYYYPPVEHAGTRRVTKFAKYLPTSDYQPVVLTTSTRGSLPDDAATGTYRAHDLIDPIARPYRALLLRSVPKGAQSNAWAVSSDSKLSKLQAACLVPDMHVTWYPLAVREGRRIVRLRPIKLLYSSSPPETNHLVALKLRQETGLPWVADFRDGWMFEPLVASRVTSPARRIIETRLERKVVLNADHVVTVNDTYAEDLIRRYPFVTSKISVITNGYDVDDFKGLSRQRTRDNRFQIVHVGALSASEGGRTIAGLISAVKAMHEAKHPITDHLEIVLVGRLVARDVEAISEAGVRQYFTLLEPVSYRQALQHQIDADILLLVTASDATGKLPSKLFEYFAVGRPILALTGRSPAAKLILEHGLGRVTEPDNVTDIRSALDIFYQQWRAGLGLLSTNPTEWIRRYDRRELTKKLAAIFDMLSS